MDSEFRREAEIIRQVRESDVDHERTSVTAQSSPSLLPAVPGLDGPLEGVPEEGDESTMSLDSSSTKGLFGVFGNLHNNGRNSISSGFWNQRVAHTPPPPTFPVKSSRGSSEARAPAPPSPPPSSATVQGTRAGARRPPIINIGTYLRCRSIDDQIGRAHV